MSVKESLEVAIAEAVDGEFAVGDGSKEASVFRRPGTQSADAQVTIGGGLADVADQFGQRGVGVD